MVDSIRETPISYGSQLGLIPVGLWGGSTVGYSALNFPENTQTAAGPGVVSTPVEYPMSRTNVTPSGHVIQYNDTPAGERVLVKHRTGTAIDMLPDGSMSISSKGKTIFTIRDDMTIVVEGDVNWAVNGNFNLDVKGNYNVKALNVNTVSEGDISSTTQSGSINVTAAANLRETVKGSKSSTVAGTVTSLALGDVNTISGGAQKIVSQGDLQIAGGGATKMSSQGGIDVSSPNINIGANSITVIGASGTIGGAGVMMYANNIRAQGSVIALSMQADTFHGDLNGTASDAVKAGTAGVIAPVVISPLTITAVSGTQTALPNGALITDYLTVSSKGIVDVKVDADGEILNALNRSDFTGGLSINAMDTAATRSALRDEANLGNSTFVSNQVAAGALSPTYASYTPPAVNRAAPVDPSTYLGNPDLGVAQTPSWIKPGPKPSRRSFLPDFSNYISSTTIITENTVLMKGIKLATFLRES